MSSEEGSPPIDLDAPLILATADAHIGPRLKEDLREYCPKEHLEEYDAFIKAYEPYSDPFAQFGVYTPKEVNEQEPGWELAFERMRKNATAGHYDVYERLKDMDRDGVAAEVVFHGSQNGQCFPFIDGPGGSFNSFFFSPIGAPARTLELIAVGQHMYNRWLADQCSVEPERHVGLAHLPMWDIDAAVRELEWAASAGLKSVNFPAPKPGVKPYDHPDWEPLWNVCEEHGLTLSTHDGTGVDDVSVRGPHSKLIAMMEEIPRKMLPRILFSGLFERHPKLRLVMTELQQPLSRWVSYLTKRYDELWEVNRVPLREQVPRPPSEYLREHVFFGNSLFHVLPQEVAIAIRDGYAENLMWGTDYPHMEGSYSHPDDDFEGETMSVLGLRAAFNSVEPNLAKQIVGETLVNAYGLDREKLAAVARRINAISLRRVATPLSADEVPEDWWAVASFHRQGSL